MTLVKSPLFIFLCRLANPLSSDVGQVIVFIVRFMISPHHKDNLQPLRSQSPKRLGMTVSFSPLVAIVFVRPLTSIERVKRKPVRGVAQQLVTGKSKHVRHDSCHSIWLPGPLPLRPEGGERIAIDSWHRPTQPKAWARSFRFFLPAALLTSSAAGIEAKKRWTFSL